MTNKLKNEIKEHLILAVGETTKNGLPISMVVEDIASIVDRDFSKAVTEACELGPMLEAVGLEIRSREDA